MAPAWAIVILGIWTIIVPFFGSTREFYSWDNFISGIAVSIAGVLLSDHQAWRGFLCVVLGFWLIISSYIPPLLNGAGVYWNSITTGIVLCVVGFAAIIAPLIEKPVNEY